MKISNVKDLTFVLNKLQNKEDLPIIETPGFSKFKNQIFKVSEHIEKGIDSDYTISEQNLHQALVRFSDIERKSLMNSMLTSYFTPDFITRAVADSIANYIKHKLKHAHILEPSSGTGNFIQALFNNNDLSKIDMNIVGIEKDIITHRILSNNFKEKSKISTINKAFENYKTDQRFDFIIGNVPFGNYDVYDSFLHKKFHHLYKNRIHNYFFLKSSELLKPGGVMAFITTSSMNDISANKDLRKYLVEQNNLISFIRLPNSTFKESATAVVSDLLVFQKPLEPKIKITNKEEAFIETGLYNSFFSVNQYILENSDHILGYFKETTGFAGKPSLTVEQIQDSDSKYNAETNYQSIYNRITMDFEKNGSRKLLDIPLINEKNDISIKDLAKEDHKNIIDKNPNVVPGNIIYDPVQNDFFRISVHPSYFDLFITTKINIPIINKERFYMLIEIRDIYKNLLFSIRENNNDNIKIFQDELNFKYDQFNFMYAELHQEKNLSLLKKEEEYDLILGLEIFRNNIYQKADIFFKLFNQSNERKKEPLSLDHAIINSLNEYGKIDTDYISNQVKLPLLEWANIALNEKSLFLNPIIKNHKEVEKFELVAPSKFLSGYIESKIKIYHNNHFQKAGELHSLLTRNVIDKALKSLYEYVPVKLNIDEIDPNLGENWIPNDIYSLFGKEHFEDTSFEVRFFPGIDRYKINGSYKHTADAKYGVSKSWGNVSHLNVFKYAMEHNVPGFTKTIIKDGKETKIVDRETINSVRLSVDKLNNAFSNWLITKKEICTKLEEQYHFLYNANVKRKYSSDDLKFEDLQNFTPYDHQKECAIQIIQQNGGIIDHEVGFGKSLTMPMITMTKKKFGIIKKELVAGLNANYVDLYNTYKKAYPNGKYLLVTPKDIVPNKKQETFYRIANNDWDAVITAHSCLAKFPKAPYTESQVYNEMITEVETTLEDSDTVKILSRRERNQLERKLETAKARYQAAQDIIDSKKEKGTLIFEDLGFDSLTIDESQFFKNLSFNTRHVRVAGLGSTADTLKTSNLLSYIRSIQNIHKSDKGITFASGTTISNSITELYHIFRYLRPLDLQENGIHCFDQWARLYARKTSEYEESVDGNIKLKERFRYFVKAPELAKFYNDITHYSDFNTFKMDRPQAFTKFITIDPFKDQLDYFNAIQKFAQTKNPKNLIGVGSGDNIKKAAGLICTNQGRKSSLDMRLIHPSFGDHPNNKVNTMIRHSLEFYHKFTKDKGTQLIFCDQGTPNGKSFNLYQAIKNNLINKGIPENEIAFIHSYDRKRKELYEKVNNGEIRYLIGSTSKMGVGVNVQKRIVALHHLDFPWRPTDLSQRNGRGERTGNIVLPKYDNKIAVLYYGVKNSLDAYIFNLLHIKDNFIKQLKNASISSRILDEGIIGSDGHINLEDFQALCSPNQLLTEKLKIERQLQGLLDKEKAFQTNKRKNLTSLSFLKSDLSGYQKTLKKLKSDKAIALPLFNIIDKKQYKFNIDNKAFIDPKTAGKYLLNKLDNFWNYNNESKKLCDLDVGFSFQVFPKIKDKNIKLDKDNYRIVLETPNDIKIGYKSGIFTKNKKEVGNYLLECLTKIKVLSKEYGQKVTESKDKIEILEEIVKEEFSEKENIKQLKNDIIQIETKIEKEKETGKIKNIKDSSLSKKKIL